MRRNEGLIQTVELALDWGMPISSEALSEYEKEVGADDCGNVSGSDSDS